MAWLNDDCRMFAAPGVINWIGNAAGSNLAEYTTGTDVKKNVPATANANQPAKDKEQTATVTILEAKKTKNGNTRAVCKIGYGDDEQIIVAKNDAGETIQKTVGKRIYVRYNVMSDGKAWFAINAKPV